MRDRCEWCDKTSVQIDSLEFELEAKDKLLAEWNLVLKLTTDECSSVTIHHDNADFNGENCAITHETILKKGITFYGETKLECLERAYELLTNRDKNEQN